MKKALIIFGIIFVVVAIIGVMIFVPLLKEKEKISAKSFKKNMEDKGYTLYDVTDQYEGYADKVYIAKKSDCRIEFYDATTLENAVVMFNTSKSQFEMQKGNNSAYSSVNGKNFSTYKLQTNGKYKYLSRVEDTLIYIDVDEEYKDTIKDIIKELGY